MILLQVVHIPLALIEFAFKEKSQIHVFKLKTMN